MPGIQFIQPGVSGGGPPLSAALLYPDSYNLITTGQENFPRGFATSGANATATGSMHLTFFTAYKAESAASVRLSTGTTAAAATPTLVRLGIYSVAANGAGTLVGSSANDTTLFAATFTPYTKALSTPVTLTIGQRYATAILVVTGGAAPTFIGQAFGVASLGAVTPRLASLLAGQTDLPASFADAALSNATGRIHQAILP